jgi:Rrf2 family protein
VRVPVPRTAVHALHAAVEMGRAWPDGTVTAADVSDRHRLPPAAVAKAFQRLVRAGLAVGIRGGRGGYQLARSPRRITIEDVVLPFAHEAAPEAEHDPGLAAVFREIEEVVRCTYASTTLDTVLRRGERRRGRPEQRRQSSC